MMSRALYLQLCLAAANKKRDERKKYVSESDQQPRQIADHKEEKGQKH